MAKLILPTEYLMGRDRDNPLTISQSYNMADLLSRVNWLISRVGGEYSVTSGYRPSSINATVGGAKLSAHTTCQAIDLAGNELAIELQKNTQLLIECGLYLEHPDYTEKWTHLQSRPTKNRVFIP